MHGGKARQVQAKAAQRNVEAQAAKTLVRWGVPRAVDPLSALGELLAGSAGLIDFYAAMVEAERAAGRLSPDNPWLRAFDAERDRLGRLSSSSAGLGLQAIATVSTSSAKVFTVVQHVLEAVGRPFDDNARRALRESLEQAAVEVDQVTRIGLMTAEERISEARKLRDEIRTSRGLMPQEAEDRNRVAVEGHLRRQIADLEAEVARLRERVQSDGLSTRLAITAGEATPDVLTAVHVDNQDDAPEVLEPDEILPPEPRPRQGQSLREHFTQARRSAGYRR